MPAITTSGELTTDQVWELWLTPFRRSVGEARHQTRATLTVWGVPEDAVDVAELIVSELVTNAIRHASAPIQLRLIRNAALICEVSDSSSTAPHPRRARALDEGGRGLFLVGQLAERWGTRHTPTGKTIWAEQPRPLLRPPRRRMPAGRPHTADHMVGPSYLGGRPTVTGSSSIAHG